MHYHLPQSSLSAFSDAGCPARWPAAGLAAAFGDGSPHLSLSQPESVASAAQQASSSQWASECITNLIASRHRKQVQPAAQRVPAGGKQQKAPSKPAKAPPLALAL